jgi:hypothetical protein
MAYRMSTATRMDRARANGRVTRVENGHRKKKARAARDARMKELIGKGKFPFTPAVMSWVSEKLGKPSTQATEAEIQALAK